jgi:Zn finger protein HypA/HybF involved in hydrogenase expression
MNKKDIKHYCLNCGSHISFKSYSSNHIYCNNKCQQEHKQKNCLERDIKKFHEGTLNRRPNIRLVLTEIRGYKCECCGISDWQGKKLVLQVDHINGDPYNDSPENLRLICPNCHSQTSTYTGANRGKGRWSKEGLARYYK